MKKFLVTLYIQGIYLASKPKVECLSKFSSRCEIWSNIIKYVLEGMKHFARVTEIGPSEFKLCDQKAPWYGMIFFHEGYAFSFWSARWLLKKSTPGVFTYWGLGLWNAYIDRFHVPRFFYVPLPSKDSENYVCKLGWYYDTYYWFKANTALKLKTNSKNALLNVIKEVNDKLPDIFKKYAIRGIGRALWLLKPQDFAYILEILHAVDDQTARSLCIGMGNAMTYTRIQFPEELLTNLNALAAYHEQILEGVYISMEIISLLSNEGIIRIAELYQAKIPEMITKLEKNVALLQIDRDNFFCKSAYFYE